MQKLKKYLSMPFTWTLALIFLIEEALWDWTAALMAKLGTVRLVHVIESRIAALPPYRALLIFMLPSITLIPAKLIALHAISTGHWLIGGLILLLAKLFGMALFSRIFNLTRPALMQLLWFVSLYGFVMHYRNRIHDYLANWAAYQHLKQRILALLGTLKSSLRRKQ